MLYANGAARNGDHTLENFGETMDMWMSRGMSCNMLYDIPLLIHILHCLTEILKFKNNITKILKTGIGDHWTKYGVFLSAGSYVTTQIALSWGQPWFWVRRTTGLMGVALIRPPGKLSLLTPDSRLWVIYWAKAGTLASRQAHSGEFCDTESPCVPFDLPTTRFLPRLHFCWYLSLFLFYFPHSQVYPEEHINMFLALFLGNLTYDNIIF